MDLTAFREATALERRMLELALPLSPTVATGDLTIRIDGESLGVAIGVSAASIVAIAGKVVRFEDLGLQPLLFATAWKVLDVYIESVLRDHVEPDQLGGYRIETKKKLLTAGYSAGGLTDQTWTALAAVYVSTIEVRHSLVHRRVWVTPARDLVGQDRDGADLAPFSAEQQEAFIRAVLRLCEIVDEGPSVDPRSIGDLAARLRQLSPLHDLTIEGDEIPGVIPEVTVVVRREESTGRYNLDVPGIVSRPSIAYHVYADLVVEFADQPGRRARGRLESAPRLAVSLDPDDLPGWLT